LAVAGSTTKKALFEAYAEGALAPSLSPGPGRVVVLDDLLGAHKGGRVRESVEGRGRELPFLPPCSPGFSPIEEAFSKIEALLGKAAARTREAPLVVEAMGGALDAVTAQDAWGFFGHCGYPLTAQPS
jgi:transposase